MSKEDLDTLIDSVVKKHNSEISEMKGHVKRLEAELKKREEVSYLERRGQESLKSKGVEVHQARPLNPIDHQAQLVKENKDKLKGKVARFVTNNESLRSLRRAQGYEPVRDEDGDEVRYMDGVLMGIPEQRYKQEIESDREYRRSLRRQQLKNNLEERGAESGVETFGDIDFDDSPVYDGG
jgi:mRNA-degrading endonuclease RelE of RelBE toxin-antitoxin system